MPEKLVVEKVLAEPVIRANVTKVELPESQHFTVVLGGKQYAVWATLEDTPKEVQDWILALGEAQAKSLLGGV
jgi:hypothetical protein